MTSLRLPRPLPDVPGTVTVIPREEIDRTPALGTDDVLRAVPSAATFRRTPSLTADPTSQGLNLRGVGPSGVSRALVLLDGIPVNDPFGGWVYWRALPRLGLDRVEVAPGGTSALYGNYALGGVVHLVSRPIANHLAADAAAGALATFTGGLSAAGRRGPVGGAIELEGLRSDGYVPVHQDQRGLVDRAASSSHGALNVRVEGTPGERTRLGAHARLFSEDQNGGTTFTTAEVRTADLALSLGWAPERFGELTVSLFGGFESFRQDRARILADRSSEDLAASQDVPSQSQGASAVFAARPLAAAGTHLLMIGADARRVAGAADETINPAMVTPMSVVGRRSGGEQRFAGVFVQELYQPRPAFELALALRLDGWSNVAGERTVRRQSGAVEPTTFVDRSAVELSPRVGVLVRPTARTRLRGTAYRAFRAPTLNELYRPFQVGAILTAANEELRAEHLLGADAGVEWLPLDGTSLRLTGFWTRLEDPIVNATLPMPMPGGPMRQRQNLGRARINGLELAADVRLGSRVVLLGAYTLADSRVTEAPAQPELVGKRLPQDPVHRGRLMAAYTHPRWAEAAVQLRAQGAQFDDDLNQLDMNGFVAVDLFAAVPIRWGLSVFGSAQNLLDRRYLVSRAPPAPAVGVDTFGPPMLLLGGLRYRSAP